MEWAWDWWGFAVVWFWVLVTIGTCVGFIALHHISEKLAALTAGRYGDRGRHTGSWFLLLLTLVVGAVFSTLSGFGLLQ